MKKRFLALLMGIVIGSISILPAMAITGTSIQRTNTSANATMPEDVPNGVWYWDAAKYVLDYGLMSDVNGNFSANTALTREKIAKTLYLDATARSMPIPDGTAELQTMSDYSAISADCLPGLSYCVAADIFLGDNNHALSPQNLVTRQELATIMMRYCLIIGYGDTTYSSSSIVESYNDVANISTWAYNGISFCSMADLIKGDDLGNFNPQDNITRAQFAQILLNLDNKVYAIWNRLT